MKCRGALLAVLAISWLSPLGGGAASLRSDILAVLPQETGEVGFIDLQSLRASPHYALLKQRFLPGRFMHFERFVRSLGVDVDNNLEWLAWVLVPPGPDNPGELFLGVAQGEFAPERVEEFFLRQKLPSDSYFGQTLFPFGRGGGPKALYFTFLDSSTAAFGTRRGLELLLGTRLGEHDNLLHNEPLLERVSELNGNEPIWIVLNKHYTRLALRQLVPDVAKFEEFSQVAEQLQASSLQLSVDRELTLSFQAWCAEPADAQIISLLLQTGLAVQSWRVQESNPALSSVLSHAVVRTAGNQLEVEMAIEESDLQVLLQRPHPLF